MKIKKDIQYTAQGLVAGKCWMGGIGIYDSRYLVAKSFKELKEKIAKAFNSGELDSGFGFESLVTAKLNVIKTINITINGKTYTRDERSKNICMGDKKHLRTIKKYIEALYY